jgi:hypothetical protein
MIAKHGLLGAKDVAYTNYAKCWQTLGEDNPDCSKPMKTCGARYKLSDLATAIECEVVLMLSADSTLVKVGFQAARGNVAAQSFDRNRIRAKVVNFAARPNPTNKALAAIGDSIA